MSIALAPPTTRRRFSLLEMVLAMTIGMMLLLALYVSFTMYIGEAQSGREIVNEAALARNILTRIGNDVISQIGPVDPRVADYSNSGLPSSTAGSSPTPIVSYN